ncbi:hypothetical protein D3C73_879860 [compost metagenome]
MGKLAGKVVSWKSDYLVAKELYAKITPHASDFATITTRQREIEMMLDIINDADRLNRIRDAQEKLGNLTELYKDLSDMTQAKRGNIILMMVNKSFTSGYLELNNFGSLGLYSINFEYGKYIPTSAPVTTYSCIPWKWWL